MDIFHPAAWFVSDCQ